MSNLTPQAANNPTRIAPGSRIAVIGAGISGLSAAWLLGQKYQVSLFEAQGYFGGHSNTVDVTLDGVTAPVDTGFLVHNDLTYPNLIELFRHFNIPVHESDMSFGVSIAKPDLEWAGTNLATVFAQRANLLRPRFWGMLRDIMRFNSQAQRYLDQSLVSPVSLGELLDREGYGAPMRDWYLLPMAAAIWSSSIQDILQFSASSFLAFCLNHRLLQIENRPKWRTVLGGSRVYVQEMLKEMTDVRLGVAVQRVSRAAAGVSVFSERGEEVFDAVVMACHAPQALALLDAHPDERTVLSCFKYQPNDAVLHTDAALLPRRKKVWSAWNYLSQPGVGIDRPVAVSYLINLLQPLPFKQPVVVTLNPFEQPAADKIIARFEYDHPVLDQTVVAAQKQLPAIQGLDRVWFCGAWTGYGFHEDGLKSALRVVRHFGVQPPWEPVYA